MAREINWDEPLSDSDRAWAEQRPDQPAGNGMTVAQRLAAIDEQYGNPKNDRDREKRMEQLRVTIADSQNELERLQREIEDENNRNVAVGGDASTGNQWVDNTGVNGEKPDGSVEGTEDYSDTRKWTVDALKGEIEARNADRKAAGLDEISTSGKRAELVERLLRDDEELAATEENED